MKLIAIILLITGVSLVVITLSNQSKTCPPPQIEYRFVPRTFKEQQESPIKASEIFSTMFDQPTPFINSVSSRTVTKDNINRFFISQG